MAQTIPPKVNPGDLITASYMDQIIDALSGLDQRVSKLEATGSIANPVQITGYTANQPVHVGDQIEIDGSGFLVPAILNQVAIGGAQVTSFASGLSTPGKLLFTVPSIVGATDAGTPVTVTVTNANGTATSTFQILVRSASTAPKGRTQLVYDTPPVMPNNQQNVTASQIYEFGLTLTAITDQAATYAITFNMSGAGWSATPVDPSPVTLSPNASTRVRFQVTAAAGSGLLSINAQETTPGSLVTPGQAQITITAGSPPPTPETRVRVTLAQASLGAVILGTGLLFTRNTQGTITYTILFTEQGNYAVSAVMRDPTGWTSPAAGAVTPAAFQVNAPPPGGTTPQNVNVQFTAGATAANKTDLVLTVTRGNDISVPYSVPVTVGP